MKKLYIVPISRGNGTYQSFGLVDKESKEILYRHTCSHSGWAYGDLIGKGKEERQKELSEKYGDFEVIKDFECTDFIK